MGNRLYHNSGNSTFTRIATGPGADIANLSFGCDWGDYDNDGFLDLFVANATLLPNQSPQHNNFLYHNDGNTNRWLKVKLVGTTSNRAAIGAKVRVQASFGSTTQWQLREISVGCNQSGHNLLPHFGLRDAQQADVVRIEWPSGIVQELRNVSANQTLTITEPPRLVATSRGLFRIGCWLGQRFEIAASPDLVNWSSLGLVTNQTGTLTFNDSKTASHALRYYRAISR